MSIKLLDILSIEVFGSLSIALLDISLSVMTNLIQLVSIIFLDILSIDLFGLVFCPQHFNIYLSIRYDKFSITGVHNIVGYIVH